MASGRMALGDANSGPEVDPTLRPDSRLAFRRPGRLTHGAHRTQGIIFADERGTDIVEDIGGRFLVFCRGGNLLLKSQQSSNTICVEASQYGQRIFFNFEGRGSGQVVQ